MDRRLMHESNEQALQASVAAALLGTFITLLPVGIGVFLLAGEWLRAERAGLLALVLLPAALYLRLQLRRGRHRLALLGMSLLGWAGLSTLLFSGGTIVSPVLPILLSLSVVGALAQHRLLTWLLPLLCSLSLLTVAALEHRRLLPLTVEPSGFGLILGTLLAMGFLALLARISSRHLAQLHRQAQSRSQDLQRLSRQLQLALEAGKISCFSLDPKTLSLEVDAAASRLLRCAEGRHSLAQLTAFSLEDRRRIAQAARRSVEREGRFPVLDCRLQDGSEGGRWYRLFAAPSDESGPRLICALQDIHEQMLAEQSKEHFTAMVSHELRTPLTALLGALRLLQGLHRQGLPAEAGQLLDLAIRGGDRLASLVNDILDFLKLQAGAMRLNCRLQPIGPVLEEAIDSVQALLQERQLSLELEAIEADALAYLDPQRAQQVLINLLANAIKFSPPGSQLRLGLQVGARQLRISLSDSGPGIDADFQTRIFKPFSQAETGNTRDTKGTGLGLSISRQLMRQMGGELSYESPPGQGATFHADFLRQAPALNA